MVKKVIGLTGGIASGKSTVTQYIRDKGFVVIDADALVHQLQGPGGELYQALLAYFGPTILNDRKELDRPKLAKMIFSTAESLEESAKLQDDIIRKAILEEKDKQLQTEDIVFLDIPLLFEKAYDQWCDIIWLVDVTEEIQKQRLKARNGYSDEEVANRLASQWPLDKKREMANVCIDNNGTLEETYQQVDHLLESID